MSHNDRDEPRKRRRLGLLGPMVVLLLAAGGWSGGWFWLKGEVERRMDMARAAWTGEGRELAWERRRIYGFPFRLDVDLAGVRMREPSGWALAVPEIEAEAFVFAPTRWVALAPQGVVFTRRSGGPVVVRAKVLRASLSEFAASPPRLSVEGIGLSFRAPRGANPYFITAASQLHIHTRAGPADQGAVFFELDKARARLGGLMGRIAGRRPVNITADLIYSHASALAGADWPSAVTAWASAGGAMTVRNIQIAAGDAILNARSGTLTVGDEGRLNGALTATLREAPRALQAMGEAGTISPEAARTASAVIGAGGDRSGITVTVHFQAGRTTLGPAAIGPAPRLY
ncbi:MAG TPA: DUF2125 domain-containing protein [Caulobacteraceae bacterium]